MWQRCWLVLLPAAALAGEWPVEMTAWQGTTPTIDGVLAPGEWDDAATFEGVEGWTPQFTPTTDPRDLAVKGWVKHDGRDLFFAFLVTDDVLYGIDTSRWLPPQNAYAHELSRRGYPWFGDEMELLINASNTWISDDKQNCSGDGSSWQMVCNLTKSRLGGVGTGGLLEGEPRSVERAWNNYQQWILDGDMVAVAKLVPNPVVRPTGAMAQRGRARLRRPDARGGQYVIEWQVKADPCLEVRPGIFWSPALGVTRMGLNIALGDLDEKDAAPENFGYFHHEDWWAGEKNKRTWLKQWGTLVIEPGPRS